MVLVLSILFFCLCLLSTLSELEEKSPFHQGLPVCSKPEAKANYVTKKTNAKGIICPMIKDEEGFLSEWVAYYQIHGFDKVLIFDDGSTDRSLVELQPWIDSGFVTVRSNWTTESLNISGAFLRNEFKKNMAIKAVLETQCKLYAIENGYEYHISLDLDEYVIPIEPKITVIDALEKWSNDTGRGVYCLEKMNFQQSPHTLEPVHLLTIEAYQTRMKQGAKMNYYTSVAPKCAFRLKYHEYTNMSALFIAYCCHFHGCQGHDFIKDMNFCKTQFGNEAWRVNGKGKKWQSGLYINHYSRSLEKYAIKGRTWRTATGETRPGESSEMSARSYDIPKFLARSVGWYHDDTALRYSCQVRDTLRKMTKESSYLRPGNFWYRNAEFGKEVTDPEKRGRYGRPNSNGFKFMDGNPYHYHGNGYIPDSESVKA